MSSRQESALIVEIPDVESAVAAFRKVHDPVALRGIPAHVTVLYPFRDPAQLSDALLDEVEVLIGRHDAFDVSFTTLQTFPNVVWLGPDPDSSFKRITSNLVDKYPDCPPYMGKHEEDIPHLTIAQRTDGLPIEELEQSATAALADHLPIAGRARAVSLYVSESETEWRRVRVFPFADPQVDR